MSTLQTPVLVYNEEIRRRTNRVYTAVDTCETTHNDHGEELMAKTDRRKRWISDNRKQGWGGQIREDGDR